MWGVLGWGLEEPRQLGDLSPNLLLRRTVCAPGLVITQAFTEHQLCAELRAAGALALPHWSSGLVCATCPAAREGSGERLQQTRGAPGGWWPLPGRGQETRGHPTVVRHASTDAGPSLCSLPSFAPTAQISQNYICITSVLSLPPFHHSPPLDDHRAPGWAPCVI